MTKRAAIYARVSRAYKEDDERLSIETQVEDCEEFCRQRGYTIVRTYIDKDKFKNRGQMVNPSGTRKDRPGYVAMLKAAMEGEIEVVVAWKEDRLYRGAFAAIPLVEALDERRGALTVDLVRESFDPKMLMLKASIGKLELDAIRERTIRARQARVERGEVPGGSTRYGYAKDETKRLIINESEAAIVRKIYEWYVNGSNNMEIRKRLNGMGVPPRFANVWSKMTLQNVLTFPGYATGEFITVLDGVEYTIPCPPIISMETWQRAIKVRAGNKFYPGRNVKQDFLCRGLVTCPCGWKMGSRSGFGGKKNKKRYGYYGCQRYAHQPEQRHPLCPGTISARKVDEFTWNCIRRICWHPEIVQTAIDAKLNELKGEQEDLINETEQLQREMDAITQQRQWVITMARQGRITVDDMDMQLGALHFQMLDLQKRRNDQQAALAATSQVERLKAWAAQYMADIQSGLDLLDRHPADLSEEDRENLYLGLEAARFEGKYNGDKMAALQWAIFEEKRRIVKMLISRVVVIRDSTGEKTVKPQLSLDLPEGYFVDLVHHDQSPDYSPGEAGEPFRYKIEFSADELGLDQDRK